MTPRTPSATALISAERRRQIDRGYSPGMDALHISGQLASAAACYAQPPQNRVRWGNIVLPADWPWAIAKWHPTPEDRIRELVKAGALIVAEIERLQRLEK